MKPTELGGMTVKKRDAMAARAAGQGAVRCHACPLRQRSAFRPKDADEIAFIDSMKIDHRILPAGAEIIYAGQEDAELYTLFSGWAFRQKTLLDGRRQILNFILPGDLIGLQASLLAAAEHGIETLTEVEVCVFSRRGVWRMFQQMPELSYDLAWLGARGEGILDENLTSVGQRGANERMAALILSLYRRADHLDLVTNGTFRFPLTRQHLADALGLSLVHTIRTWSHLRRAGLFSYSGDSLTLLNPRLTERLASFYEQDWRPRPIL